MGAVYGPTTSNQIQPLWRVDTDHGVQDLVYDDGAVWVIYWGGNCVYKYSMEGKCIKEVGQGKAGGKIRMCIDTRRRFLVLSGGQSLFCMNREGGIVREIRVPGAGDLYGVVYCEERDVYVLGDTGAHCLWYLDAGSGAVVRQVGSEGSGEGQFRDPYYLCHHHVSEGECHVYVSDRDNHRISVYTASGEYIRRFESLWSNRVLSHPRGVCVVDSGRVVVCHASNKRVVRYWWERDVEKSDVILTPQQLGGEDPLCVDITDDIHMVVGTTGSLLCFRYTQ